MTEIVAFVAPILGGVPDWANWTGFVLTVAGFFVSTFGLIATYKQAKDAKKAAIDAKEAANNAIKKMQNRSSLSSLFSSISQINTIIEYVHSGNVQAARASFDICSRNIKDVHCSLGLEKLSETLDGGSNVDDILKEISAVLDVQNMAAPKKASVLRSLRAISDTMSSEVTSPHLVIRAKC